jgi:hypothetical protein
MSSLIIEHRFCGPPGYAHGGYLSGVLASHSDRQLRIRLLRPVSLDAIFQIHTGSEGEVELRQGEQLFARGEPDTLQLTVPDTPSYLQALDASRGFSGFAQHAFPRCFACGTERARGDGLRIFAGPLTGGAALVGSAAGSASGDVSGGTSRDVPGAECVAATWTPDASLAGSGGKVRPEFMTAALDCPGYFAARNDAVPMLLGEFTAHVDRCVHIDEPCIVVGWKIAASGRKYEVGTALFDEDGEPCARAHATWIEPRMFPR